MTSRTLAFCMWCTVIRWRRLCFFFFSSRRRHTRFDCDWSSDVCSSDLHAKIVVVAGRVRNERVRPDVREVLQPGDEEDRRRGDRRGGDGDERGPAERDERLGDEQADGRDQRSEERRVGKEWRSRREKEY